MRQLSAEHYLAHACENLQPLDAYFSLTRVATFSYVYCARCVRVSVRSRKRILEPEGLFIYDLIFKTSTSIPSPLATLFLQIHKSLFRTRLFPGQLYFCRTNIIFTFWNRQRPGCNLRFCRSTGIVSLFSTCHVIIADLYFIVRIGKSSTQLGNVLLTTGDVQKDCTIYVKFCVEIGVTFL